MRTEEDATKQGVWREWATHRLEQPLSTEHKKQKLELIPESAEKKSGVAGSENTAPEVSPFAKPLSIPGIHFGSATNFTINLNFGQF